MATRAPATPLSALVFCTISFGVQFLRPGWPKTSPISCGGRGATETAGATGACAVIAGRTGAVAAGMGILGATGAAGAAGAAGVTGA